jgi:hypothetical protein
MYFELDNGCSEFVAYRIGMSTSLGLGGRLLAGLGGGRFWTWLWIFFFPSFCCYYQSFDELSVKPKANTHLKVLFKV